MSHRRRPSEIRFSQDTIKSHWSKFPGQIGETLDQLLKDEIHVDGIEKITVKIRNGILYSADNRRLWVFQKLEKLGKCESIEVIFGSIDPKKFTTKNCGTSVLIRGRGDPGGRFWKSLEKDTLFSTFTAAIDKRSGLEARPSPTSNECADTTLSSAFENAIKIDKMEKNICLSDIGYFQTTPISDGEYLGDLLDNWLQLDCSKCYWELQIFKRFGRYYTTENARLWALKKLEKFGKSPQIEIVMTDPPLQELNGSSFLHSVSDSLKLRPTALTGGSVWKNIIYLQKLPTLEIVKSSVSDIFFTKAKISDTYENKSIAKELADSCAAMKLPNRIRVVKFEGKYYALDNEILWIAKETQRVKYSLQVSVELEVKIEMDPLLFQGFMSEKIQEVTIQQTTFSHTNEELFIVECLKRNSTT